jgi:hypothetical protein
MPWIPSYSASSDLFTDAPSCCPNRSCTSPIFCLWCGGLLVLCIAILPNLGHPFLCIYTYRCICKWICIYSYLLKGKQTPTKTILWSLKGKELDQFIFPPWLTQYPTYLLYFLAKHKIILHWNLLFWVHQNSLHGSNFQILLYVFQGMITFWANQVTVVIFNQQKWFHLH